MSKNEVLNQIYPDEIEYIFDIQRRNELEKYTGYLNQFMAASSAFGGGDNAKKYIEDLIDHINLLSGNEESSSNIDDWYQEYEELKEKETKTIKDEKRIKELKEKMNNHIDSEINKLKGLKDAPGGAATNG